MLYFQYNNAYSLTLKIFGTNDMIQGISLSYAHITWVSSSFNNMDHDTQLEDEEQQSMLLV